MTEETRPPKPPLPVRVAPLLLLFTAVYSLAVLCWILLDQAPAISLDGRPASPSVFNLLIAPLVVLGSLTSLVVGWGIRKERKWARRLAFRMAVLLSILTMVGLFSLGRSPSSLLLDQGWRIAVGLFCLHFALYGRGSVKDYFDRLESV